MERNLVKNTHWFSKIAEKFSKRKLFEEKRKPKLRRSRNRIRLLEDNAKKPQSILTTAETYAILQELFALHINLQYKLSRP